MKHLTSNTINNYLDKNLTENELNEMSRHLDECPNCKSELELSRLLFESVQTNLVTTSDDFSIKVMKEIEKTSRFSVIFKRMFNPINLYIIFFITMLLGYAGISSVLKGETTKQDLFTDSLNTYYTQLTESLFRFFEPVNSKINLLFQKEGLFYLFLGVGFIILFVLFDKYVVEKSSKRKSISTFLI